MGAGIDFDLINARALDSLEAVLAHLKTACYRLASWLLAVGVSA